MKPALPAIAVTALLLGALAAATAYHEIRSPRATTEQLDQGPFRGSEPPARIRMPAVSLRDYTGAIISSPSLRGKVTVLTFLDTRCKEACPIIAGEIASTAALLTPAERDQVVFVAITSDPTVDTPAAIRAFLERHHSVGTLHYLSGPVPTLRRLWRAFQILSSLESGEADTHSAPVRIYSRDGIWLATQHPGADLSPANLAHDIRVALRHRQPSALMP